MTKDVRFSREIILLAALALWAPVESGWAMAAPKHVKPKQAYKLSWEEKNHRIVSTSICAQFDRGSLDYRRCRSYALDYFQEKCHKHSRKHERAGGKERKTQRRLKDKYCAAYRALP